MEEQEDRKISKYSSGINIIVRLDNLWKDTHTHSRNGNLYRWNSDLNCIWLELARDFKDKASDWEQKEKDFDMFEEQIEQLGGFHDKKPEGFEELDSKIIIKRNKVYKILMKKQLFLARLENELGKGSSWDDGDEDDF